MKKKAENYEELSMVDSYILHVVSNVNYVRCMKDLNKEIDTQIKNNNVMMQKSLQYANNPYTKK